MGHETSRLENELSDSATPDAVLASKEIAVAVNAAIDDLSEDLRQAIVLREIEGLSYEEIAAAMGCPIGTVRSRIFRAREAIASRLAPFARHPRGRALVSDDFARPQGATGERSMSLNRFQDVEEDASGRVRR